MPELPEVETVRRGLALCLEGRTLARVVQRRADLRFPLPERFAERLQGRRVEQVGRRAKYLAIRLDDGMIWLCHLGMSGRMLIGSGKPPAPEAHDHVLVETDDGGWLRFNDARRFGMMDLWPAADLATHRLMRGLGPEPLDPEFDGPALAKRLKGKATSIKAALLDQRVVAGLGNIYVSEALHHAGLSPRRIARTVQGGRADRLAVAIRKTLEAAIEAGGSSLRDYVQTSGELGYFQHRWVVYEREGKSCRHCGRSCPGIKRIVQAGRSTYYCPRHQR
ncbi:MAG: bifunctional DNA-formamidopyrimidine glycosylase/DNA-(apurinic or apyrimidinic site) lyase [Dongiaceae bacterium]